MQRKPSSGTTKPTLFAVSKDERRALVSPQRMYCIHCSMPKGITSAEVTPKSKKIKPVAL